MVGENKMCMHVGCMGCGKTYGAVEGFGLYCAKLKSLGIVGLNFVLLGRTQSTVKKNMCNVLSKLYGVDFKYDGSRVNGIVKDATLFGQNLFIIGFNDSSSESKFRGLSDIMGILHDEAVFCTKEQFDLIMSRLRGEIDVELPDGYVKNWYIGSTNPDAPTHFILDYINKGIIKLIQWYAKDACWDGFTSYFERQKRLNRGNKAGWERYIQGKWSASDNMVYPMFYYKKHVIEGYEIDYTQMKRTFIAVDYGSNHPTAILLISKSWSGEYIVSKELKLKRTAVSDIVQKISEYIAFLRDIGVGCDNVYVDPSAVALKDEMTKLGIEYTPALNGHEEGIGAIRNLFSLDRLFILETCEELVAEIFGYVFKDNKSGKDEVVKVIDDLVDAMRYGVYTDSVIRG
jgi:PBSX family phage terminase large subunit